MKSPSGPVAAIMISAVILIGPVMAQEQVGYRAGNPFTLFALAGGVRYMPIEADDIEYESSLDPVSDIENKKKRYNDQWQSFGIIFNSSSNIQQNHINSFKPSLQKKTGNTQPATSVSEQLRLKAPRFYYQIRLAAILNEGKHSFQKSTDTRSGGINRTATAGQNPLSIYPGNNLYLGLKTGSGLDFILGRRAKQERIFNYLTGGHGPLTGLHALLRSKYGNVSITPYHRHALAGSYLGEGPEALTVIHDIDSKHEADLLSIRRNSESYGQQVAFSGSYGYLRLALAYGVNTQNESAGLEGHRKYLNRIEYSTLGLGLAGAEDHISWSIYATVERSLGYYRTLYITPERDRFQKIDGAVLLTGGELKIKNFYFRLKFFLPEPASKKTNHLKNLHQPDELDDRAETENSPESGPVLEFPDAENPAGSVSTAGDKEQENDSDDTFNYEDIYGEQEEWKSGYITYGDSPLRSPILSGTLGVMPAPTLCRNRDRCTGIETQSSLLQFRNHAAVLNLESGFEISGVFAELRGVLLKPLALRDESTYNPFARLKYDESQPFFMEFTVTAGYTIFAGGRIALQYSRLVQKDDRAGTNALIGEAMYVYMTCNY